MASNGWQQYGLRGSVRIIRSKTSQFPTEHASATERSYETVFLPDGRLLETLNRNPDGSTTKYYVRYDSGGRPVETIFESANQAKTRNINEYDEQGRLTRMFSREVDATEHTWSAFHYHADGSKTEDFTPNPKHLSPNTEFYCGIEGGYGEIGAAGARRFHKAWDNQGRPCELLSLGVEDQLLARATYRHDDKDLLIEQIHYGGDKPLFELPRGNEISDEDRAALEARFGPGAEIFRQTFRYDDQNRLIEIVADYGAAGLLLTRKRYDETGNIVEESHHQDGEPQGRTIMAYEYDAAAGNWTSCLISTSPSANGEPQPLSVERREFDYF